MSGVRVPLPLPNFDLPGPQTRVTSSGRGGRGCFRQPPRTVRVSPSEGRGIRGACGVATTDAPSRSRRALSSGSISLYASFVWMMIPRPARLKLNSSRRGQVWPSNVVVLAIERSGGMLPLLKLCVELTGLDLAIGARPAPIRPAKSLVGEFKFVQDGPPVDMPATNPGDDSFRCDRDRFRGT